MNILLRFIRISLRDIIQNVRKLTIPLSLISETTGSKIMNKKIGNIGLHALFARKPK